VTRFRIEVGRRFVEDENLRVAAEGDSFADGAISWVVNHYLSTPGVLAGIIGGLA
jgi:hypothetical protein